MIDDITHEKIPFQIYLPQRFLRLYIDELADIGRKLDRGNELLGDIKKDTSTLPEIKAVLGTFTLEQKEHNLWMKDHSQRLEKILA